jgi:mitochondrial pyruvate carrier 2
MATPMRYGLRAAQTLRHPVLRQNLRFTQRRTYASAAENPVNVAAPANASAMAKFWNSPVGPKTVHFWAPIMKVWLTCAGV